MLGGFKLWVRRQDTEVAIELLSQGVIGDFDVEGVGKFKQFDCPKCQSRDIWFESIDKRGAGVALFLGIPVTVNVNTWHCNACNHRWQEDQRTTEDANGESS